MSPGYNGRIFDNNNKKNKGNSNHKIKALSLSLIVILIVGTLSLALSLSSSIITNLSFHAAIKEVVAQEEQGEGGEGGEEAGLELSQQPVYRRQITTSQTPINQTHILLTVSGNGTITLPNTTEAINFTGTGSLIASLDGTAAGKEVFTTVDGSEVVNATVFAISRFNMEEGTGKGILLLLLQTNSTGRLAPVNGMIVAGQIEYPPEEETALVTVWEWQSGIPLPPRPSPTPTEEPSPLTDTTTTNATTTAPEADGATPTAPPPEGEVGQGEEEGGEEEQEQQQTTPTIPAPNPLFE
jgi:hypothetical protein